MKLRNESKCGYINFRKIMKLSEEESLLSDTTKVKTATKTKYLPFLVIFGGSLVLFTLNNTEMYDDDKIPSFTKPDYVSSDMYTIRTEGCLIPGMKELSKDIKPFVFIPLQQKCPKSNHSLILRNRTHIWLNQAELIFYNITNETNVTCCIQPFYRPISIQNINNFDVDRRATYKKCVIFDKKSKKVDDEFVKVSCKSNVNRNVTIYENFFAFAPKKTFHAEDNKKEAPKNKSYNVIILGIDAVSRLNFRRTMPKTVAFIEAKNGIELHGYNKVGDNSFPNLVPFLMGYTVEDLKHICHPHHRDTFDTCPFIWHVFKEAGYYTAFGEDSNNLATFNYLMKGFVRSPTDYYFKTFIDQALKHGGANKKLNSYLCVYENYSFKLLLDYIEDLTVSLKSSRLFGFFWEITMSHDFLNNPMVMDEHYERFLQKLNETKYLEESIIILMSDHGIRWGNIRSTKQGRMEERLPLMYFITPPSFDKKYSLAFDNLRINAKRLTTPFDVHSTLLDLANLDSISNKNILKRSEENYANNKSISLFLPVPRNRTCKKAGIEVHWCTCHSSEKFSINTTIVWKAAKFMIKHLNNALQEQIKCAKLKLKKVIDANEIQEDKGSSLSKGSTLGTRSFLIVIQTIPSNGIFEATLRRSKIGWQITGTVSRLNLHKGQSKCVNDAVLKLYCYCVKGNHTISTHNSTMSTQNNTVSTHNNTISTRI